MTGRFFQALERVELSFLDFQQRLHLIHHQEIDFFMEPADLQFRFEVGEVVVFSSPPVFGLLPVLAHHDDRRLKGRKAGENQIEENERVGVKALIRQPVEIGEDPDEDEEQERQNESPAASKGRDLICEGLGEGEFQIFFLVKFLGEKFFLLEAFRDNFMEPFELLVFSLKELFNVGVFHREFQSDDSFNCSFLHLHFFLESYYRDAGLEVLRDRAPKDIQDCPHLAT